MTRYQRQTVLAAVTVAVLCGARWAYIAFALHDTLRPYTLYLRMLAVWQVATFAAPLAVILFAVGLHWARKP